jgi:hypothetical protein
MTIIRLMDDGTPVQGPNQEDGTPPKPQPAEEDDE